MITETCSCGASITQSTDDTITTWAVVDWRENHRHEAAPIPVAQDVSYIDQEITVDTASWDAATARLAKTLAERRPIPLWDINPAEPAEPPCCCGDRSTGDTVHRSDGPCYQMWPDAPAASTDCTHRFKTFVQFDGGQHVKCILCGFKDQESLAASTPDNDPCDTCGARGWHQCVPPAASTVTCDKCDGDGVLLDEVPPPISIPTDAASTDEPPDESVAVFSDSDGDLIPMKRFDDWWYGRYSGDKATWAECLEQLGQPIAVHVPGAPAVRGVSG